MSMSMVKQTKSTLSVNLDWDVLWERYGIATVLLIGWIFAYFFVPKFNNPDNMLNVIRQSAFVGCAAVGMTVAIMSGTFDLSIGSTLALSAYLGLMVVAKTESIPLAMLTAMATGMIVGASQRLFGDTNQDSSLYHHLGHAIYSARPDLHHLKWRRANSL